MYVTGITPVASQLTKTGKMQSAGCRLCRIAREARSDSTAGLLKHMVKAAKGWQRQSRLPTTSSGGTCMTACMLQKIQKAASSDWSFLTKKVLTARCGDMKSFLESAARKIWRRRHRQQR